MLQLSPTSAPVLVAHPDPDARAALIDLLAAHYCQALEAGQAAEAIHLCRENTFPIILLAADWPDTDGYAITTEIRRVTQDTGTYILILADHVDRALLDRVYQAGGDDFLIEPVQAVDIAKKILHKLPRAANSPFDYAAIFENITQYSKDAMGLFYNGRLEFVNPAFERLCGYSAAEICRPNFIPAKLIDAENYQKIRNYLEQFTQGKQPVSWFEIKITHQDGHEVIVEASVNYLPYKDGIAAWGILRDVTEIHQARELERELTREKDEDARRYEALFEQSNDAIFILDLQGKHLACNQRATKMFGYDMDELLQLSANDLVVPEEIEASENIRRRMFAGESIPPYKRIFRRKNGSHIEIEANVEVVRDKDGAPLYIQSILRDTTEREREQRLAKALRDTANMLNSSLDLDLVLDRILTQAARVVPHTTSSVALIEGTEVKIVRCRGYRERGLNEADILALRFPLDGPSNHRRIIESKRGLIVANTQQWPDWIQRDEVAWIRSNLSVPIIISDSVIGFLHVDSEIPNQFTQEDMEALQSFAAQVATAIHNARLYEQTVTMNRATSFLFTPLRHSDVTVLGQYIVEAVVSEFGKVDCGVMLLDPDTGEISRLARAGDFQVSTQKPLHLTGTGLVPEAMRTAQVIYAPDVRQHPLYLLNEPRTNSELVIPLVNNLYQVIGALDLQSEELNAFGETDLLVLTAFAERATMSIENAQHTQKLEANVEERSRQLQEKTEQIKAIFDYTSDAIILVAPDGEVQQDNPAFRRLFDIQEPDTQRVSLQELVASESVVVLKEALNEVVMQKRPVQREIVTDMMHGDMPVMLEIAFSPLLDNRQQVSGVVCVMHDITTRKKAERDMRQMVERELAFHEFRVFFFSRASHEFRTPLAVIMTSTELLRNYSDRFTPEQRSDRLEQIQEQVRKMVTLIEGLTMLNKSTPFRYGSLQDTRIDAAEICMEVIAQADENTDQSHQIVFSPPDHNLFVKMDANSFRLILSKLVENALQFSAPGSLIQIRITPNADQMVLEVEDQGIGIPETDQARLFEIFYRGSNVPTNTGAGLGLAIIKKIIDLYGGNITFTSTVDVGTIFTVTLPYIPSRV
ncbi:MAG: PAS domain S-box protein [Anaerolineaceae bacterium]|nr:PAS domain S-box protein [Anaerolineaceae bacterium]